MPKITKLLTVSTFVKVEKMLRKLLAYFFGHVQSVCRPTFKKYTQQILWCFKIVLNVR